MIAVRPWYLENSEFTLIDPHLDENTADFDVERDNSDQRKGVGRLSLPNEKQLIRDTHDDNRMEAYNGEKDDRDSSLPYITPSIISPDIQGMTYSVVSSASGSMSAINHHQQISRSKLPDINDAWTSAESVKLVSKSLKPRVVQESRYLTATEPEAAPAKEEKAPARIQHTFAMHGMDEFVAEASRRADLTLQDIEYSLVREWLVTMKRNAIITRPSEDATEDQRPANIPPPLTNSTKAVVVARNKRLIRACGFVDRAYSSIEKKHRVYQSALRRRTAMAAVVRKVVPRNCVERILENNGVYNNKIFEVGELPGVVEDSTNKDSIGVQCKSGIIESNVATAAGKKAHLQRGSRIRNKTRVVEDTPIEFSPTLNTRQLISNRKQLIASDKETEIDVKRIFVNSDSHKYLTMEKQEQFNKTRLEKKEFDVDHDSLVKLTLNEIEHEKNMTITMKESITNRETLKKLTTEKQKIRENLKIAGNDETDQSSDDLLIDSNKRNTYVSDNVTTQLSPYDDNNTSSGEKEIMKFSSSSDNSKSAQRYEDLKISEKHATVNSFEGSYDKDPGEEETNRFSSSEEYKFIQKSNENQGK